MTTPSVTPTPELVYAQAIPILAGGLYPEKLQIIREYIQNASDAIDAFRQIAEHIEETTDPLIKIMIQGRSLNDNAVEAGEYATDVVPMAFDQVRHRLTIPPITPRTYLLVRGYAWVVPTPKS